MYKLLGWHEYFLLKLGADPLTDSSLATRYLIFDINKRIWIEEYLEYFGISRKSTYSWRSLRNSWNYIKKNGR